MENTSDDKSISEWIADWKERGDQEAAQRLWERYYPTLVELARRKLGSAPKRVADDEEDVAVAAFNSFFLAAQKGRFPQLDDRDDLWQILLALVERKAADQVRRERRLKRGGEKVRSESARHSHADGSSDGNVPEPMQLVGRPPEPTPEFAAIPAEELRRRIDQLPSKELRQIALWKLEGYTNKEIAQRLGCIPETVERKLRGIRAIWSKELRDEGTER